MDLQLNFMEPHESIQHHARYVIDLCQKAEQQLLPQNVNKDELQEIITEVRERLQWIIETSWDIPSDIFESRPEEVDMWPPYGMSTLAEQQWKEQFNSWSRN
jgi:hypothetical protein